MLKHFRLIAMVLVSIASCFEAMAQTENFKDVLLNGKPAKLNLVTGEVTYVNGEIAKSRAAKKIKDSLLATRTEIKTNLLVDMPAVSESPTNVAIDDTIVQEIISEDRDETSIQIENSDSDVNLSTKTNVTFDSKLTSVSKTVTDSNSNTLEHHIVNKNETLYSIAKRYNTSVGKILIANNLDTTIIKEGQKLLIYGANSKNNVPLIRHLVNKGDTLIELAIEHNTTVADIKAMNNLKSDTIKIGQELKILQNSEVTKK